MKRKKSAPRRDAGRPRGAPVAEAVLRVTLEELASAGFEGLSVERIAQRAEVNKTTIYRRWPTREALAAAALEAVLDDVGTQLPDTGSLRGDLAAVLAPVAALAGQPLGRAIVRAALSDEAQTGVAELAARKLAQGGGPIRTLVARARARGEWRAGVKGELLLGALVGAILHRAMLEHGAVNARWIDSLIDLTLFGVLPREEASG